MNEGDLLNDGLVLGPLGLGLTFILLAAAAWLFASSQHKKTGLPSGKVVYSDTRDTDSWSEQEDVLYSSSLQLSGRPDYLVEERDGSLIPVEVKSGSAPRRPHQGHVLQLAAYCLLVEEVYGIRPSHGIIQYRDNAFAVTYSEELEDDLLDLLADMREDMFEDDIGRSHDDGRRCVRCGVRQYCNQRIG
jgi:CRISPR-associated exonuclease Cas4